LVLAAEVVLQVLSVASAGCKYKTCCFACRIGAWRYDSYPEEFIALVMQLDSDDTLVAIDGTAHPPP
jgi:hypothetical protein